MKITKSLLHVGVLGLTMLATSVMAAVPAAEADKLGKSLTPMGAEMGGNADGSIPAWKPWPRTPVQLTAAASWPTRSAPTSRCLPSMPRTSSSTKTNSPRASTR